MSQIQEPDACVHNSFEKKLTHVEHDKAGLLPLVMLCPDCISFYESAYYFKIIHDADRAEVTEKQLTEISKNPKEEIKN